MSYANQRLDVNPGVMVLRVVGGAWICRHGLVLSTCDAMRQQCAHSKMLLNYCYLNYCYCCDAATVRTLQDAAKLLLPKLLLLLRCGNSAHTPRWSASS